MLTKSKDGVGFSGMPTIREVTAAGLEPSSKINDEVYMSVVKYFAESKIRARDVVLICPVKAVINTDGAVFPGKAIRDAMGGSPGLFKVNLVILPVGSWISIEIRKKKIRLENKSEVGLMKIETNPAPQLSVAERYRRFIARAQRAA